MKDSLLLRLHTLCRLQAYSEGSNSATQIGRLVHSFTAHEHSFTALRALAPEPTQVIIGLVYRTIYRKP